VISSLVPVLFVSLLFWVEISGAFIIEVASNLYFLVYLFDVFDECKGIESLLAVNALSRQCCVLLRNVLFFLLQSLKESCAFTVVCRIWPLGGAPIACGKFPRCWKQRCRKYSSEFWLCGDFRYMRSLFVLGAEILAAFRALHEFKVFVEDFQMLHHKSFA